MIDLDSKAKMWRRRILFITIFVLLIEVLVSFSPIGPLGYVIRVIQTEEKGLHPCPDCGRPAEPVQYVSGLTHSTRWYCTGHAPMTLNFPRAFFDSIPIRFIMAFLAVVVPIGLAMKGLSVIKSPVKEINDLKGKYLTPVVLSFFLWLLFGFGLFCVPMLSVLSPSLFVLLSIIFWGFLFLGGLRLFFIENKAKWKR